MSEERLDQVKKDWIKWRRTGSSREGLDRVDWTGLSEEGPDQVKKDRIRTELSEKEKKDQIERSSEEGPNQVKKNSRSSGLDWIE